MVVRGPVLTATAVVACGAWLSVAEAQPAKPAAPVKPPIGATQVLKLTTDSGFVDDVIAYDNQRVAYVVADTSSRAELHVAQLGTEQKPEIVVDIAPITLRPVAIKLVGQKAFVIGATDDGAQVGAMIDLTKPAATSTYKVGPAADITVVTRDGKQSVAVHKRTPIKTGTRHEIELLALETGKRISKSKPFEVDTKGQNTKLDFHVNHWSDGWTRVSGLKGGEWVKKENQRSPDTEATYDLVSGKFVENKAIADVVEQRKRFQSLADAGGQLEFAKMAWDNSAINVWARGVMRVVEIDRPLQQYEPKTLQGVVAADGSAWLSLKIDPVNPEAVNRKKADPEYLDIFKLDATAKKAVMKARIYAKDTRFKFGVIDGYFWLLERSPGFDRGGRNITIYQLQ